jgi:hypothetical protein
MPALFINECLLIVMRHKQRGRFQSYFGFNGFALASVTAGMTPVFSILEALLQVKLYYWRYVSVVS